MLCQAGKLTRGPELVTAYEVYRMDIEIHGDEATIAKKCVPTTPDPTRRGCNFWDFIRHAGEEPGNFDPDKRFPDPNAPDPAQGQPDTRAQVTARQLVADPWAPTASELRNWYKFNLPAGANQNVQAGAPTRLRMQVYFPDLYTQKSGEVKGDPNAAGRMHQYFEWDNYHLLIGKTMKKCADKDRAAATPHLERIKTCLRWAQEGRRADTATYKKDTFKKVLQSFGVTNDDINRLVVEDQRSSRLAGGARQHFGTWTEINYTRTADAALRPKKQDKKSMDAFKAAIGSFEADYAAGDLRKYKVRGTPVGGSASAMAHMSASEAIDSLLGNTRRMISGQACTIEEARPIKLRRR